jgi:PIN domain nuclease of toxin-antitoxin system
MRLLLDTCTFLWIVLDPTRLSARASQLFTDPVNSCFLSAVSSWEIAVKFGLGRVSLQQPPQILVPAQRLIHGIVPLPLNEEEAVYAPNLPQLHKDPFDRMLICQAIVQGLTILTPDLQIRQYPLVQTDW